MTASARNWKSLLDLEEIGLEGHYYAAICNLAAIQANEEPDEGTDAPDISEPEEIISAVSRGSAPNWWPAKIDRLSIVIKVKPQGSTPENIGPHPLDPNTTAGDLGLGSFTSMLGGMLELTGVPFDGNIQIRISRRNDRSVLGGWKGDVYVGEKEKKKGKKGNRAEGDDILLDRLEYLEEKAEKGDEAMHRMFQNASNVIHASASAINAMRGANVAPPWMNGAGEEEPFWMTLARGAADVVLKAGLEDQSPQKVAGQLLRQPVRPQQPGVAGPNYDQRQIAGPTADEPDLGYGEYLEEGDFDGYPASEGDLIEDDFDEEGNDDYEDSEYEDEDDDHEDDEEGDDFDIYEAGFEDSGDAFNDPVYDDNPEPQSRGRRRRRRGRSSNPLDGLSPEDIATHLGDYIDKNPDKKAELKGIAMGTLARKLL